MVKAFSPTVRPLRLLAFAAMLAGTAACSTSQTLESAAAVTTPPPVSVPLSAKHAAIVVDGDTGRTLYESNSTQPRFPASLTKMMTVYMIFDAMESGRMNKATPIPFSAHAASRPPTKLGVRPGQAITAEIAIKALVTKSANDVAAAVGEYLAGSEERFGAMMTAKARSLGMRGTTFRNASGLPDPQQQTTARDMAILGIRLRRDFPQYYAYFSTQSFQFNGRTVNGHNRLLKRIPGADGIKTGFIRASGFNIVTSVTRGKKHLIGVVMGGDSGRARDDYAVALLEHYLPPAPSAPVTTAYVPETGIGSMEEGSAD